eukprot:3618820-Amphidinium_carterae.1
MASLVAQGQQMHGSFLALLCLAKVWDAEQVDGPLLNALRGGSQKACPRSVDSSFHMCHTSLVSVRGARLGLSFLSIVKSSEATHTRRSN